MLVNKYEIFYGFYVDDGIERCDTMTADGVGFDLEDAKRIADELLHNEFIFVTFATVRPYSS